VKNVIQTAMEMKRRWASYAARMDNNGWGKLTEGLLQRNCTRGRGNWKGQDEETQS
jgi:hypothetical protein